MRIPDEIYKTILENVPIICVDGLVLNDKGQFLLLKRKNPPLKGEWFVPGGRLLRGESLKVGFIRKMREELGISVVPIVLLGFYEEHYEDGPLGCDTHSVSAVFLATYRLYQKIKLDHQSSEWKFSFELPPRLKHIKLFNAIYD